MSDYLGELDKKSVDNRIRDLEARLNKLENRPIKAGSIEEISNNLGLQQAGEFRAGNGLAPGSGFTGGRFGYPGFVYEGKYWFLVGVNNDVLQVGLDLATGDILAGAGSVRINSGGILIEAISDAEIGIPEILGTNAINYVDTVGNLIQRLYCLDTGGFYVQDGAYNIHKICSANGYNTEIRQVLTGDITFYVRTDGSDFNNGLANTAAYAFKTIQRAINARAAIDGGIYNTIIQLGDGSHVGAISVTAAFLGSGTVTIRGNVASSANVAISTAAGDSITVREGTLYIEYFSIYSPGNDLVADAGGKIYFSNLNFGGCGLSNIRSINNSLIQCYGNYVIFGGAAYHYNATTGVIKVQGFTVTLWGTPAFSSAFAFSQLSGTMVLHANTYNNAATGKRYDIQSNAVAFTNGGGANYFPGNSAGTTATGGQYL